MSRPINMVLALSVSSIAMVALQTGPARATTATTSQAELIGKLGYEGGAYPDKFHPTAGSVEVEFDSVTPLSLVHRVGPSGHFEISLPAGEYTVIGCGPATSGGTAGGQCGKPVNLTLTPGEIDHIKLVWAYTP
jgi:hypothetical protein